MRDTVRTRTNLRPRLSPIRPRMTAPMGRAMKPTAQVAKEESNATRGVCSGKKTSPKTRPAANPYRAKSTYSMVVPNQMDTMVDQKFLRPSEVSKCRSASCDSLIDAEWLIGFSSSLGADKLNVGTAEKERQGPAPKSNPLFSADFRRTRKWGRAQGKKNALAATASPMSTGGRSATADAQRSAPSASPPLTTR